VTVDRTDRAIIAALTADSRLSIRSLAERVHISRSAANARVQKLVADGVIKGFTTRVDRRALGINVAAIVIIRVGSTPWPDIAARLAQKPYVESVLAVSGDIDLIVTVNASDHEHLSDVILREIHELPGVVSTRSHVILDSREGSPPGGEPSSL
jgi:DNA-binding Lrp family transcriptional regulator